MDENENSQQPAEQKQISPNDFLKYLLTGMDEKYGVNDVVAVSIGKDIISKTTPWFTYLTEAGLTEQMANSKAYNKLLGYSSTMYPFTGKNIEKSFFVTPSIKDFDKKYEHLNADKVVLSYFPKSTK